MPGTMRVRLGLDENGARVRVRIKITIISLTANPLTLTLTAIISRVMVND